MQKSALKISLFSAMLVGAGFALSDVSAAIPTWDDYEDYGFYDTELGFVRHEFNVAKGKEFVPVSSADIKTSDDKLTVEMIRKVIPTHISDKYLARVVLAETNDGSAFAGPISEDGARWEIVVDVDAHEGDRTDLKQTAIHEVAHVLSLNDDQLETSDDKCTTLEMDEGCLKASSYLYPFYQKFWQGRFKQDAVFNPYNKAPSAFVSEYAATNLAEDFAETFAIFVMEPKPDGHSLAEQKVRYLYDFPELMKIRDRYQTG